MKKIYNIMATLAEKPERLVLADEFLYNHVPNALKIIRMYMTVQKQTAVSQFADEQLEQAQNTLVALFKEIHKPIVQSATLPTKYTYDLTGLSRKDKQAFQTAFATGYNDIQIINDLVKADAQLQTIADRYQFELFTPVAPRASVVILVGAVMAGILPNDKVAVLWLMPATLLVGVLFLTQPTWQMKGIFAVVVLLARFGLLQYGLI
ncbi:5-bromo-4-chloroindolyl phosphate hydrolysis family protein [Weissella confusa]|uniref:5-bromo-4-chloroindolyl phosphate hydrolysis family protein n=1 Tax=Weissella confusa TaxID=1583 RepID=A0A923ND01_WEICO|nr:5-bromo-4-chloroindolyl phosphate hydrolysis family protein [Weissella confusa]